MSDSLEKQLRHLVPQPLPADFIARVERTLANTESINGSSAPLAKPQHGTVNYSFSDRCLLGVLSLATLAAGVIVVCLLQDVMVSPAPTRPPIVATSSPPTPTLLYYQRTLARSSLSLTQDAGF